MIEGRTKTAEAGVSVGNLIAALALVVTLLGALFVVYGRLEKVELQVDQAQLPQLNKDLQSIRDDVAWLRHEWERERKPPH